MIHFHGVTKSFGNHVVLNDLSLHIKKGQLTFIVGKSGEGKSVTIKHIMGLLKPDRGQVVVDGHDLTKMSENQIREQRKKFGMLFQHAALFDSMTVGENVLFPLKEHTKMPWSEMLETAESTLSRVGLPNIQHKYPSELSTGEKKRVGLARAPVNKPKILLYDEPTTGFDPLVCEMIDELIVKVNEDEKDLTSIVISHDLKATLATAQNIIMLYKGQVILSCGPETFRNTDNEIVRQFFSGKVEGPMEFF